MRLKQAVFLPCIVLWPLLSCQEKEPETIEPPTITVTSVSVSPSTADLVVGESLTLQATVSPSDATVKTVTWTSSNPSVASVTENGSVLALSEGSATINASADGKTGFCQVTVSKPFIAVQSVALKPQILSLVEGESAMLVATITPDNATDQTVSWSSSYPNVASIDQNGNVKANKAGKTTITASVGGESATCEVTVTPYYIEVQTITLSESNISLNKGDTRTLTATVKPDDASDKTVTWHSSNENVVTVTDGVVIAVGGGNAVVSAEAGGKTAECSVSVNVPLESISLDPPSLSLDKGTSAQLTASLSPSDATDKKISWTSSDETVATVTDDGLVYAKEAGTAVIIAVSNNKTATCNVRVTIPVDGIVLDHTSLSLIKGESCAISATISPDNASDKTIIWSTSNSSIAIVEDNGLVRATGAGTAIITADASGKKAQCTVFVSVPLQAILLNYTNLVMYVGQQVTLTAGLNPSDATDVVITWHSSDPSVVSVNNGQLTASREGTAVITASFGSISASCSISVDRIGNGGHEGVGYEDWN